MCVCVYIERWRKKGRFSNPPLGFLGVRPACLLLCYYISCSGGSHARQLALRLHVVHSSTFLFKNFVSFHVGKVRPSSTWLGNKNKKKQTTIRAWCSVNWILKGMSLISFLIFTKCFWLLRGIACVNRTYIYTPGWGRARSSGCCALWSIGEKRLSSSAGNRKI